MLTIKATLRKEQGKGASRRMRVANKFPAIVYGGHEAPVSIEIDHDDIMNTQSQEGFYRNVIALVIDGNESKVKVQAVQRHPFKPKLIHLDFIRAS